jgi:hypothetical protein
MVLFCVSCAPIVENTPTITPTATPTVNPTSTSTSVPPSVTPAPTATIQIERWMEYEQSLAKKILPTSKGICEWEILGQNNQEVYVWAICQVSYKGAAASLPAVIHIGSDGNIEEVQIPGDGTHFAIDVGKMFPQELQELIFQGPSSIDEMWSHIELRQVNPEPPLIVLSGVTLP